MPRTSKSCAKCTRAGRPGSDLRSLFILSLSAHGEEQGEEAAAAAAAAAEAAAAGWVGEMSCGAAATMGGWGKCREGRVGWPHTTQTQI